MSYKMYLGYFILVPLLLVFWIYIVLLIRNNFISNTSIEVNIIGNEDSEIVGKVTKRNITGITEKVVKSVRKIKYHVPKFMLELYEKNKSARRSDNADLVRSLIPAQAEHFKDHDVLEEFTENHLLIFNIPHSAKDEKLIGAELKILTKIEIRSKEELGVKKTLKLAIFDETTNSYQFFHELQIHHFNDTWLSFNLTHDVQEILKGNSSRRTMKIIITVFSLFHQRSANLPKNNLKLSILPVIEKFESDHDYPILILSYCTEDKKTQNSTKAMVNRMRTRRNVEEDYEEETNVIWNDEVPKKSAKRYKRNLCRRKPMYINFSEINYDLWIVQPTGYDAYQCHGKCFYPVAEHLKPTKHAIMQSLIHSMDPSKTLRSCCVPTILDSISILYVDDKGVLTYRYAYKDMVVIECGCR
ncbi:bone morphogenetic protein 10-like [Euwallacea fornicatus]|uniref:bone morphogenetic protein 10-like n=1 Tax=Euwallacea fornicatus TaxID=995702 RepID=UPI00338E3339